MSAGSLDQLLKGAPPPNTNVDTLNEKGSVGSSRRSTPQPSDPTSLLPSSPPQIYLNLLILEASLRQQYLTLRARKRQHTLVVAFLWCWTVWFFYRQFLRPREDGTGIGGSVYWLVDMGEKVALIGGCVMAVLFWATGQWERGMRWPRKWLGTTNRGLRTMNCKIVILRGPWWSEALSNLSFLTPLQGPTPGSSYHYVEFQPQDRRQAHTAPKRAQEWAEEDVAPGGDHVKILLLPKQFTPDFRENWEVYRAEYWETENTRRAELRKRISARERERAKIQGGWLWWTGWRGWTAIWGLTSSRPPPRETTPTHHVHSVAHQAGLKNTHRRRPSTVKDMEGTTHSRSSSRSSIPDQELRERRWSTASSGSTTSSRRRSKLIDPAEMIRSGSITARASPRMTPASKSGRPETPNPELKTRNSALSTASDGSSTRGTTPETGIKVEPAD